MNSLNSVHLIGNLGVDPEVKHLENDKCVANISMATTRGVKKGDDWENVTEWHKVVFWGKMAILVEKYLKQGSKIAVVGELRTRSWVTENNEKRYSTEIYAKQLIFLDRKNAEANMENPIVGENEPDDDLPF